MKSNSKLPQNWKQAGKARAPKWMAVGMLSVAFVVVIGSLMIGCQGNVPSAAVMIGTPCPTPVLMESFESLTQGIASNGTTFYVTGQGIVLNDWDNSDKDIPFTSVLSLSNFYATQGNHSLDVDIVTPASYDQHMLQFTTGTPSNADYVDNFTPVSVFGNISQIKIDATVDPSVVAGASYGSMVLIAYHDGDDPSIHPAWGANWDSTGKYFVNITGDAPNVVAGFQTFTWNINLSLGSITATDRITRLYIVYNRSAPAAPGQGLGHIYFDNLQFIQKCP